MAGIRQFQRRAIETLVPHLRSLTFHSRNTFFLDGQEVFFRGLSRGEGTCSDLHGVTIAVFSDEPNEAPSLPSAPAEVRGAVFLRDARTKNERNSAHAVDGQCVLVVEAIHHTPLASGSISFRRIGKKKAYIPVPS